MGLKRNFAKRVRFSERVRVQTFVSVSRQFLTFSRFLVLVCCLSIGSLFSVLISTDFQNSIPSSRLALQSDEDSQGFQINNFGQNRDVKVATDRDRDVPQSQLKTILMWNDAYGVRDYDIGHGREPFYKVGKNP